MHALNTVLPRLWCDSKCLSLPGILQSPEGPCWCACTSWSTQDHPQREARTARVASRWHRLHVAGVFAIVPQDLISLHPG